MDKKHHQQCGFTLHETVIVSLLIGVLATQGVPGIISLWDRVNVVRIANTLLMVAAAVRQQAIANERGTLLELSEQTWCARFIDEQTTSCSLAQGSLPRRFYFGHGKNHHVRFEYTAGRGFSPLSAGSARVFANKSSADILLINSSLGRLRICSLSGSHNMERC